MAVSVSVVLPQPAQREIGMNAVASGEEHPVLWLLHGASDDHTTWLRRTSIERYASERGLAVVMPNAHLSSYANMAHGGRFYDFVSDELPRLMREFLPLSAKREDNFIAGNSMGGYGAMKIGVNHPDRYAAIGCFSAGVNRPGAPRSSVIPEDEWKRRQKLLYDGQDITGTLEDTLAMVKKNSTLPVCRASTIPAAHRTFSSTAPARRAISSFPSPATLTATSTRSTRASTTGTTGIGTFVIFCNSRRSRELRSKHRFALCAGACAPGGNRRALGRPGWRGIFPVCGGADVISLTHPPPAWYDFFRQNKGPLPRFRDGGPFGAGGEAAFLPARRKASLSRLRKGDSGMTLREFFQEHNRAALAFSGGTDSALLLWAAAQYGSAGARLLRQNAVSACV